MMKANLKKMILAAAMAAFMVSAPAMAEEEIIVEESFEEAEEIAAETVISDIEIEVVGFETIAAEEVPVETAQEAQAAETEENAEATIETEAVETEAIETEAVPAEAAREFSFENEEVIITAQANLPENAQMQVRKLEAGSEEYEAAKQIAAASTEADDEAQYSFYDVTFTVDGAEIADSEATIQIQFKTVQIGTADVQNILKIDENGASDVTAQTAAGSNMSSVSFTI